MIALFQSDRSSRDSDDEVLSPMKAAIPAALSDVQVDIARIQLKVQQKAEEITHKTHEALKTIEPGLASELTHPTQAKCQGLFSGSLNTDGGIPLNKRGSGVRRLVLASFFKAEAERLKSCNRRSIIYFIDESETSQHPNYKRFLIESFKCLSLEASCQVILTTHSPGFAAELPGDSIRFVSRDAETGQQTIQAGADVFASSRKRWASHQTTGSDCCSAWKDGPTSPLLRLSVKRCTQKTTLFLILRVMNVWRVSYWVTER